MINNDKANDFLELNIDEEEFSLWYQNWRTSDMPKKPDDTAFDIWMMSKTHNEFNGLESIKGKTVWYSTSQTFQEELCNDVYYSGVIIKQGKVIKEDLKYFWIENYLYPISKKLLSNYVFLKRDSLLYNLHYDGEELYSRNKLKQCFAHGFLLKGGVIQ